jgi:hypothetical protein
MGINLQGNWHEGTKIKSTYQNQMFFQGCFVSKDNGILYNRKPLL